MNLRAALLATSLLATFSAGAQNYLPDPERAPGKVDGSHPGCEAVATQTGRWAGTGGCHRMKAWR